MKCSQFKLGRRGHLLSCFWLQTTSEGYRASPVLYGDCRGSLAVQCCPSSVLILGGPRSGWSSRPARASGLSGKNPPFAIAERSWPVSGPGAPPAPPPTPSPGRGRCWSRTGQGRVARPCPRGRSAFSGLRHRGRGRAAPPACVTGGGRGQRGAGGARAAFESAAAAAAAAQRTVSQHRQPRAVRVRVVVARSGPCVPPGEVPTPTPCTNTGCSATRPLVSLLPQVSLPHCPKH